MWRERHVISAHDRYPSHHKMATAGRSGTGQGCRIGAITVRTFGGESVYHLVFCGLYADESAWASGDACHVCGAQLGGVVRRRGELWVNVDQLIDWCRRAVRRITPDARAAHFANAVRLPRIFPGKALRTGSIRLAAAGVLVALSVTGCGTPTNGVEEKSAAQVQEAATAAIEGASGVRVTGTGVRDGRPVELDLRIQDDSSHGTIMIEDARLEITTVGANAFVQGGQKALEALGISPAAAALGAGRWLKLSAQEAAALEGFSLDSLVAQLAGNDSLVDANVEQTELDGQEVVVVSKEDGSRLYVANTGVAYPLRAEDKGGDAWLLEFTDYGADYDIAAPPGTVELGELVWLDAVEKLNARMDEIFVNSPTNLTPNALAGLGGQLRECGRELERIGTPTARLMPVHALVEQACGEYEKGAQCFAAAASIGIPFAGTAAERQLTEGIDCGFAASGSGGIPLLDAMNLGAEITRAAS